MFAHRSFCKSLFPIHSSPCPALRACKEGQGWLGVHNSDYLRASQNPWSILTLKCWSPVWFRLSAGKTLHLSGAFCVSRKECEWPYRGKHGGLKHLSVIHALCLKECLEIWKGKGERDSCSWATLCLDVDFPSLHWAGSRDRRVNINVMHAVQGHKKQVTPISTTKWMMSINS